MIVPLPAVQAAAASASPQAGGASPAIEVADRRQTPSSQDAAEFARAAAGPSAGSPDIQASLPPALGGIGASLVSKLEQMAHSLSGLSAPAAAGNVSGAHPTLSRTDTTAAVAQIERAYMFAIETTMASRGSTESTKIFNTLLKGQ